MSNRSNIPKSYGRFIFTVLVGAFNLSLKRSTPAAASVSTMYSKKNESISGKRRMLFEKAIH